MDEYLSEKEQLEQIRDWWRENGWYLVGGVALGALLLFGWNRYNAYQDARAEAAAALFLELQESFEDDALNEAQVILERLRNEHPSSPYTDQGGLLIAVMHLNARQGRRAADQLRSVLDNTDDEELAMIARLRLARVLADQERYEEALALLDVDARGFSGRFNEVRGDIHVAMGNPQAAREAYSQALSGAGLDLVDRSLVQMKLDDLPLASTAAAALLPAPAQEPAAAEDAAAAEEPAAAEEVAGEAEGGA